VNAAAEPGLAGDRWTEAVIAAAAAAMARADAATARRAARGRSGARRSLVALAVAGHTRALVAAGWIALEHGPRAGAGAGHGRGADRGRDGAAWRWSRWRRSIGLARPLGPRRELGRDIRPGVRRGAAADPGRDARRPRSAGFVRLPSGVAWAAVAAASAWPLAAAVAVARRRGGAA
jgi:hypothetical protein